MNKFNFWGVVIALSVIMFAGCSKNDDGGVPGPEDEKPVVEEITLGKHTIELNEIQNQNILSVQDGILTLTGSLSSSELPQEGQILLQSEPTEKLPYGFLGRVTRVEQVDGNYRIETEPASLSDAFEVLKIDKRVDLVPTEMGTRALIEQDEDGFSIFPCNVTISDDNISFSGMALLGVKMHLKTNIDHTVSSQDVDIEIEVKFGVDVNTKIAIEKEKKSTINIGRPIPLVPLASTIIISPELQLKAIAECIGAVSLQAGFNLEKRVKLTVQLRGATHYVKIEEVDDTGKCQSKPLTANCSIDGSIFCGFGTALQLRMFNSDFAKVSVEPQFGRELSGNFTIDFASGNLYQTLRNTQITQCLRWRGEAKANLWGSKWEWSMPLWDNPLLKQELYLFPEFKNGKVETGKVGQTVSVSVGRNLLFPLSVGVAMYQGNTRIATSDAVSYFVEEEFTNPLVTSFPDLSNDTDYIAWSYVTWGNIFIQAAKLNQSPSIIGKWLAVHQQWEERDEEDGIVSGSDDVSAKGYIIEFYEDNKWSAEDASGTWNETDINNFIFDDPQNPNSHFYGSLITEDDGSTMLSITETVHDTNYSFICTTKYRKIE